MIPIPKALQEVGARWAREEKEPPTRKAIEVAVVLRATTKEIAASELEAMADHLRRDGRDGMIGMVGHGVSRNCTTVYSAIDLRCPDA